jgi:putative membrane-bound dehydrogenase-like protein
MARRAARGYNLIVAFPSDSSPAEHRTAGAPTMLSRMKTRVVLWLLLLLALPLPLRAAEPLRVFIRGGQKTHGPGAHEHERFLGDWTQLLTARGARVDGAMEFPSAEQLARTDVLILYAQEGGEIPPDKRPGLEAFLRRGGGLVVIHTAAVPRRNSPDGAAYLKSLIGGSWVWGTTKWLEGPLALYFVDRTHPLTGDVGNYDLTDEIYYDLDLSPDVRVLAAAYTPNTASARKQDQRGLPPKGKVTVYDIAPQIWTYEKALPGGQNHRAFVHLPGHNYVNFSKPHFRAVLLRGIAWAGKRADLNELCRPEELASLRYPEGGAPAPGQVPATLQVHPEFQVSLVAAEPLINKVMNLDWDAQGRMWVVETPEYPDGRWANDPEDLVQRWTNGAPRDPVTGRYQRPAYDRISILTDTDGDGVMDRKQIFADHAHGVPGGLELVTSFVLHRDGVIAAAAPDIWLLRDTNGDSVCDRVEKLYTGLGTRDTHAVINNLRWGFDGWIYATHGYSSSPNVTSGDGAKNFGGINSGVVRFKPDGSAFEQFSSKGGNTWGLQISWDNEVFWTQPTSGDLLMHTVLSEHLLTRSGVRGLTSFRVASKSLDTFPLIPYDSLPYVQIDWVGKFTAAAGCVIYDGGTWPAKWNYSYFTTEPTINIVHHQFVKPDGVSFTASREPGRETTEFIGGKNLWFRPIEVRVGPDGALYVVDFCNQAVIHNDTRGPKHGPRNAAIRPDRDHYYGRIWRVDHQDAKKLAVPNLAKASAADLVKALESPNQHVRMNALRLIIETGRADTAALQSLVTSQKAPPARVAALWALARTGKLDAPTVAAAAGDANEAVRKNALRAAAQVQADARATAIKLASDRNPQVRLEALKTLAVLDVDVPTVQALVAVYPTLDDAYLKAAFMTVANQAPAEFLAAAFAAGNAADLAPLVAALTTTLAGAGNANEAAKLVVSLADKPAAQDALKSALLNSLSQSLSSSPAPNWTPALQAALRKLLTSPNASVAAAALPLAVRWDKAGALAADVKREVTELTTQLADKSAGDDARADIAVTLLGVRAAYPEVMSGVTRLLTANTSPALQRRLVDALGALPDDRVGAALAAALPQLDGEAQSAALDHLLKRAPWSMALLEALDRGAVPSALLGPANVHRLRIHPNAAVSQRANALMDKLRGPEAKEKEALIARLVREVEKPGNAARGREIFAANCANCHQIGDLGNLVGPNLTGMGAHGPAELLGQILDPNREVDIAYVAISIETKDGEMYDGIVTRENPAVVELRNAAGAKEIAKADIKSRRNTGRSLMPEGFESLGAEALRDLLAFIRADSARFRVLDLSPAFTASSRNGLYAGTGEGGGTLPLARYGIVNVFGVPFHVVDPAKSPSGMNLIVLKGGPDKAHSKQAMPQRVEVPAGFEIKQLHLLGNVGGWAFPYGGGKDVPALRITAHYAGGAKEELVLRNGVEFADYIREVDVPGSKLAAGLAGGGRQVRFASRALQGSGVVEKITFESFDNGIAPTTVAVTADLSAEPLPAGATSVTGGTPAPAAATAAPPGKAQGAAKKNAGKKKGAPVQVAAAAPVVISSAGPMTWGPGVKVLLVGGGSAHDFHRFFNLADVATLKAAGLSANYTESPDDTVRELKTVDVAVLSVNRAEWATPAVRKALFDFVAAGKGLVLLHAGIWYNFKDWPEYNAQLVGGGSRGHDKLGEFKVNLVKDHPITKGVTKSFAITDELYYMTPDPAGTPIEVLAETSHSLKFGHPHPSVFVVKHPRARIAAIALGHDALAHDHPEFKKLLVNAVQWAAGR